MRRFERVGLVAAAAALACGALTIGACSRQVSGNAEVNTTDLASYAADVTSSQVAAIQSATDAACKAFLNANGSSVQAFNDYISVSNDKGRDDPEANTKADAAVAALHDNARSVDQALTAEVPAEVSGPLGNYRDDSVAMADTLARRADVDTLNAAVDKFNATKDIGLEACKTR